MKLNFQDIKIERSKIFENQKFDIGNTRIILEILRGKIYSNPIQTICQEISSNARDAHREVGKGTLPIEIKLPNKLDSSFYIRDFGPGITPDRMANIFVRYGCSTKREDNIQSGAYGLGAKSPFSYSDTFTVISITPENNELIKREYLAHIDESGMGEMSCVKIETTTEPQGTTVILYPKERDWDNFTYFTKKATTYWVTRPTILGDPSFEWPQYKVAYIGSDWELHEKSSLDSVPYALIDGIPYPINQRHIYANTTNALLSNLALRLHFKIGEIPVTANREEIDYQPHVITYIRTRLDKALDELRAQITTNLVNATSLRNAIIIWQDLRRKTYGNLLTQTTWNKLKLADYENINLNQIPGIEVSHFRRDSTAVYGCRKTSDSKNISISTLHLTVEDDIGVKGIQRARLATIFDRHPHISHVQLVDFSKEIIKVVSPTGETLYNTQIVDSKILEARKAQTEKIAYWSSLDTIKLSTIPKKIIPISTDENGKPKYKIAKIKKFISTENNYTWEEADLSILEDKSPKFFVRKYNQMIHLTDEIKIQGPELQRLYNLIKQIIKETNPKLKFDITIYGVVPSFLVKLDTAWQPFYKYAMSILDTYKTMLPTQFGSDFAISRQFSADFSNILTHSSFLQILPENSLLKKYINICNQINDASSKIGLYNDLARILEKPQIYAQSENQKELKHLYEAVVNQYTLLKHFNTYNLTQSKEKIIKDIALYIQAKDAVSNQNTVQIVSQT